MRRAAWIAAAGAGVVVAGGYPLVGVEAARSWLVPGVLASAAVAVAVGVHRHRPAAARPWYALFAALTLLLASAVVAAPALALDGSWVAWQRLLVVAALAGLTLAAAQLSAGRAGGEGAATRLDAAIVLLAVATLLWGGWLEPGRLTEGGVSPALLYSLSPLLPAAALAAVVRALLLGGARLAAGWLLLAGMAGALGGQLGPAGLELAGRWPMGAAGDLLWLASAVAIAAAALHPSMRGLSDPVAPAGSGLRGLRLAVFALALVGAPLSLHGAGDGAVAVGGAVGVGALVLVRVAGLLRRQERAEAALRAHLHHDSLTGLPNRRTVLAALGARLADDSPATTVLFVDLDGFKEINDLHGHDTGDAVLRVVARRLADAVGVGDLFGRFAGDEFVVLRTGGSPDGVAELAWALRAAIRQPVKLSPRTFRLDASVGAAVAAPGEPADDVLLRADAAMHRAKARGPGRFSWFDETLRADARRRAELDRWLRAALSEGQLALAYQPVWRLGAGGEPRELVAAEVLLRWRHPTAGTIPPSEFVPAAERNGLIGELGGWVIQQAVAQLAGWRATMAHGESLSVLINLSPAQLANPSLVDDVAATLRRFDVPAGRVGLELTETALLREIDEIRDVLAGLDGLGLRLALDDFGTGYSSLEHLRSLPVRLIKVDGTFAAGLDDDGERDRRIVAAVAGLGAGLHLPVLIEGVETPRQAAVAARLGCRYGQGFAFARPMPAGPFGASTSRWIGVADWAGPAGVPGAAPGPPAPGRSPAPGAANGAGTGAAAATGGDGGDDALTRR